MNKDKISKIVTFLEEINLEMEKEFFFGIPMQKEYTTNSNCSSCKYFKLDGGPGPIMICTHPSIGWDYEDCTIIQWNYERTKRYSTECPLRCEDFKISF